MLWIAVSLLLLLVSVALGWSLRATRRVVAALLAGATHSTPVLMDRRSWMVRHLRLDLLMAAFNRLIEEKARISDAGQEYLEQIQTTLGNLREAVVMVDAGQVIRLANPAFVELVGGATTPLGQRLDTFIRGAGFQQLLQNLPAGAGGQRQEIEALIGAETRWLEISAAPLADQTGTRRGYTLFVLHDISRQKQLEQMRTDFVANVSHELRTPVTVIKGFAQTLLEDEEELTAEDRRRFLAKIRANAERLHSLLQDLLLLSRLESAEMVLHCERVSVAAFLNELADGWVHLLGPHQRLVREFAEGDDTIWADPLRLSQVIMNLLDNVLRHARGFTEVRLATRLERRGVRILLSDNGIGIPEQDLPHIFRRFYRVDKGRSRESGGTGLGLAIVKHIVMQHRGEILARSVRGQGTTIDVLLPYQASPPASGADSSGQKTAVSEK